MAKNPEHISKVLDRVTRELRARNDRLEESIERLDRMHDKLVIQVLPKKPAKKPKK